MEAIPYSKNKDLWLIISCSESKVTVPNGHYMADEDWIPEFNTALNAWNKRFIITSPDVDGLLSAALMCDQFGAKLIGVYTTSHLILFDNFTTEAAKEALWVDHDISHPGIICMGQHLIRLEVE